MLLGFVLAASALIGVNGPASEVAAEHAEAPAGDARDISVRLANGHTNACIILDNGQVRCWGRASGIGVPGAGIVGDNETPRPSPPGRPG